MLEHFCREQKKIFWQQDVLERVEHFLIEHSDFTGGLLTECRDVLRDILGRYSPEEDSDEQQK